MSMLNELGFTRAALENIAETGIDPIDDVDALRAGDHTAETLLEYCLDGADDDRVQGWREYVARCVALAAIPEVTDEQIKALRTEAIGAGDERQVALCRRALDGDVEARLLCAEAIREAAAQ